MSKFGQLYNGDSFELGKREPLKIACCDCGLVHRWTIKVTPRGYRVTVIQDKRSTAQTRRWLMVRNAKQQHAKPTR